MDNPITASKFPTQDIWTARDVLDLEYDIRPYPDLYVDLNDLRGKAFRQEIFQLLGIRHNELPKQLPEKFQKIMFYGHRGSGKSTELWQLKKDLEQPGLFKVLFVEVDRDLAYGGYFNWEDFFQLLLNVMVRECSAENLNAVTGLRELAMEYLSEKEVVEEIERAFKSDRPANPGDETQWLFQGLSQRENFNRLYTQNARTTRLIRRKISSSTSFVADNINLMLGLIRESAQKQGFKDVLFIFDGTEKINTDRYRELFLDNADLFKNRLNCHLIFGVPMAARFKLEGAQDQTIFQSIRLPLFKVESEEQIALFGKIITQRLDAGTFVEPEGLQWAVHKSGGFPRQLIQIFFTAFLFYADSGKVRKAHIEEAARRLGNDLWYRLEPDHKAVIGQVREGSFKFQNTKTILELIDQLVLMQYNGSVAVNPLLDEFKS